MGKLNIKIGPSGNSDSFYTEGHKHTTESAKWVSEKGLTAFEYSFGRGVLLGDLAGEVIGEQMKKYGVTLSVHAPYFTNFANLDDEMIQKSIRYVVDSAKKCNIMGGERTIFHPGAIGKELREDALQRTYSTLNTLVETMYKECNFTFVICPETLGKLAQIGTVEEVVKMCEIDKCLIPCYDFGHINCYLQGKLNNLNEYRRIIDFTFDKLGEYKTKNMHIHFSKIQYTAKGELRHLTFEDTMYGPEYELLGQIIEEYGLTPTIICESKGTMAEDACKILNFHIKNI